MEKLYFTIAGTHYHYGTDFMEQGMEVNLVKDPENEYDKEAIKVEMAGLGLVGFVANSPYTVKGESMSAGRMYDRIGDTAIGKILYVLPQGVLCEIVERKRMRMNRELINADNLEVLRKWICDIMADAEFGADEFCIVELRAYGSRTNGRADKDSDLDILLEFKAECSGTIEEYLRRCQVLDKLV